MLCVPGKNFCFHLFLSFYMHVLDRKCKKAFISVPLESRLQCSTFADVLHSSATWLGLKIILEFAIAGDHKAKLSLNLCAKTTH